MDKQDNNPKGNNKKKKITLGSIIGGDFLANEILRRQANLLIMIVIMTIIYIDNRYTSQMEMIRIDKLKKELTEAKYYALAISSELTERSRQSKIEEYINNNEGVVNLETAASPLILIKK